MKMTFRTAALCAVLSLGANLNLHAQYREQALTVNLTAYDAVNHHTIHIGTKDLIRHLAGTNIPNARLLLVTPEGNQPGTTGNLNAFLRVKRGSEILFEVTSPNQFNLYQDVATLKTSGANVSTHAINRFSVDNDAVRAEIQGISTWSLPPSANGAGSFISNVNGWIWTYGVTDDMVPVRGTITAGRPVPAS